MQQAIIVRHCSTRIDSGTIAECTDELNSYLADGWRFVSATPLDPAGGGQISATGVVFLALVIIEGESD